MITAQQALSGKPSTKSTPASHLQPLQPRPDPQPRASNSPHPQYSSPYNQVPHWAEPPRPQPSFSPSNTAILPVPRSSSSPHNYMSSGSPGPTNPFEMEHPGSAPLHPAIRPQYGGSWQQSPEGPVQMAWQPRSQSSTPTRSIPMHPPMQTHTPAPPKQSTFTKQSHSPIPLPPYVKQAMNNGPTNTPKPSPLSYITKQEEPSTSGPSTSYQPATANLAPPPPSSATPPSSYIKMEVDSAPAVPPSNVPDQQGSWGTLDVKAQQSTPMANGEAGIVAEGQPPQPPPQQTELYQFPPAMQSYPPQSDGPPAGYMNTALPDQDPASIVERMMMNLKRASQVGAPI